MKILALTTVLALAGCADYGVTGSVFLVDPNSGAKGGMTATGEGTTFSGRYLDADGNVVGGGSIFLPWNVKIIPEK